MLLNGAFVPPAAALEELTDVLHAVRRPAHEAAPPKRRFLRDKRGPASIPTPPVLEDTTPELLQVPITKFGNVTPPDAHRIAAAIATAASHWQVPRVRFSGGTALDFPGDPCVWAKLEGDVEALTEVARGVMQCVEQLGFFVDRRGFRPMLAVATVTTATTGSDLDDVVGALDSFRGQEWAVDAVVLTTVSRESSGLQEFERIPIG